VRCQVAAAAEGLTATPVGRAATTVTMTLG
jgi:hypothetical protein